VLLELALEMNLHHLSRKQASNGFEASRVKFQIDTYAIVFTRNALLLNVLICTDDSLLNANDNQNSSYNSLFIS